MGISTRTRFEVFKRDGFTCQYCGRNREADGVKLHVDHVIPRAEGGGDEIENLATACADCNLGKAAKLLTSRAPVPDVDEQLAAMREKREKLIEYAAEKHRQKELRQAELAEVWNYWFEVWDASSLPKAHVPWESTLKGYVAKLGEHEVKDAMEITARKFKWVKTDAVRYFHGVCKRKIAESEGRLTKCTYCHGRIVLDRGEDTTASWHHTKCKEEHDAKQTGNLCLGCQTEQIDPVYGMCEACFERTRYELECDEAANSDEITFEVKAWDDLAEAAGF